MEYIRSRKYDQWMNKIMGPNPIKLTEELMQNHAIPVGARVCDLGSGQGLTSIFLARIRIECLCRRSLEQSGGKSPLL